jgi:hypothetical protein
MNPPVLGAACMQTGPLPKEVVGTSYGRALRDPSLATQPTRRVGMMLARSVQSEGRAPSIHSETALRRRASLRVKVV